VDYTSPVIKLNQLSLEEIYVLLQRLCELHGAYYTYSCTFGENELTAFINTVVARLGADQLLTPREITRDFLGLLNILYQNPDHTFEMLITEKGFSVTSAEQNPEEVSIKDDDLFAEFDI
jgi:hypothetical protein